MSRKPKILVVCPNYQDGTSFYRCAGPLTDLVKKGKAELIFETNPEWPQFKLADLVFFQRPQTLADLEILNKARGAGLPIWVDYDDLLTAVPDSNPGHTHYCGPEVQSVIWAFIQNADALTVSTQFLADAWSSATKRPPVVIPNAWDDDVYPHKLKATNPGIVWRGGGSHDEDLYAQKTNLEMIDSALSPAWHFIGNPFWLSLRGLKSPTVYPWKDLHGFQRNMEQVSATIAIVPLADHAFNRAKSNIAWIEASRVGAAVVAPNWPEWQKPGIFNYSDDEEFYKVVKYLVVTRDRAELNNKASWDYIKANLRLSKVNKLRLQVIDSLLK